MLFERHSDMTMLRIAMQQINDENQNINLLFLLIEKKNKTLKYLCLQLHFDTLIVCALKIDFYLTSILSFS